MKGRKDLVAYARWRVRRLRRFRRLAALAMRWDATAALLGQAYLVRLERPALPPSTEEAPRYGHGRPPHARLAAILARHDGEYESVLRSFGEYSDAMAQIPVTQSGPREPHWRCGFLWGLDGVSLYSFIRTQRPRRYMEIGSGNSTLFVDRARRDAGIEMEITSIDPFPRREIDAICDHTVRRPLEGTDLEIFSRLQSGDVLFMDGTHRVFTNSDATVFALDVLPELAPGVLVGIHDIHVPDDYPPELTNRHYSEQYLIACYLLAESPWIETVLPCWYVSHHPQLAPLARALAPQAPKAPRTIFWLKTGPRAA